MEERGLIFREKNPEDGRGVFIKLTPLGIEKRELSKASVYRFNQTIRDQVDPVKIDHFFEVTDLINELIYQKSIFKD